MINGVVRNFDIVSATQGSVPAGFQFEFPPVGTTGRTAVQATAIDNLKVHGSAKNFTVSRAPVPFSSEASGVGYLQKATSAAMPTVSGIDVKGKIGKLDLQARAGKPGRCVTRPCRLNGLAAADDDLRHAAGHDRLSRRRRSRAARSAPRASASSPSGRPTSSCRPPQNPDFVQLGSKDIRPM